MQFARYSQVLYLEHTAKVHPFCENKRNGKSVLVRLGFHRILVGSMPCRAYSPWSAQLVEELENYAQMEKQHISLILPDSSQNGIFSGFPFAVVAA